MHPFVVLATRNTGKIAELSVMLRHSGLTVRGLDDFPQIGAVEETGSTFEENALLKARTVAQATGLVAVADDSGLVVDALGGAPGIHSARYADHAPGLSAHARDKQNNAKLLQNLTGVAGNKRTARFCCVIAAAAPNGASITVNGLWEGHIAIDEKGKNGFGYDSVFIDTASGMRSAELTPEQKNACSHRGKALAALMKLWPAFWQRAQAKLPAGKPQK